MSENKRRSSLKHKMLLEENTTSLYQVRGDTGHDGQIKLETLPNFIGMDVYQHVHSFSIGSVN